MIVFISNIKRFWNSPSSSIMFMILKQVLYKSELTFLLYGDCIQLCVENKTKNSENGSSVGASRGAKLIGLNF